MPVAVVPPPPPPIPIAQPPAAVSSSSAELTASPESSEDAAAVAEGAPSTGAEPPASFAWLAATESEREGVLGLVALIEREDPALVNSPLLPAFGGRDRCFLSFLRAGDVNFDLPKALARLQATVAWRVTMGIDGLLDADLAKAIHDHPLRASWPSSVESVTRDGCPVLFTRAGLLRARTLTKEGEDSLCTFLALWLSRALELQEHTCRERLCKGTYDIYDCTGLSITQLSPGPLRAVARCAALGTAHFPENLHRCFVINAPRVITLAWKAVQPVINQRTRDKVSISSGVPAALVEALGGEEEMRKVFATVPTHM